MLILSTSARPTTANSTPACLVEVRDDLVAVLTQQIERNVAGPGDVRALKLPRGSHVESPARATNSGDR